MIIIRSRDEVVPACTSMIHIMCGDYEFNNYVFDNVTTITWEHGFVKFVKCEVKGVLILSGVYFHIGKLNNFHPNAVVCGNVAYLRCSARVSVLAQLYCCDIEIYTEGDGAWTEKELDSLGRRVCIKYTQDYGITAITDTARFIARLRADYGFHVWRIRDLPPDLITRKRRAYVHAMIAMVSARDVKRIGARSALRVLPLYLLRMCGEMLYPHDDDW